jgi:hypothetical protein
MSLRATLVVLAIQLALTVNWAARSPTPFRAVAFMVLACGAGWFVAGCLSVWGARRF